MSHIEKLEQELALLKKRVKKIESTLAPVSENKTLQATSAVTESEELAQNNPMRTYSIWAFMAGFASFMLMIFVSELGFWDLEELFSTLSGLLFLGGIIGLIISSSHKGDSPEEEGSAQSTPIVENQKDQKEEAQSKESQSWEMRFGGNYLAKIGMGLVSLGVVFFLKWSFDNGLIGPMGRIMIGLITGIAFVIAGERWSERFKQYSMVLVGGGFAILYFSVFAARFFYDGIVPISPLGAFMMLAIITGAIVFFAVKKDSKTFGFLALGGGFLSPFLMNSPEPQIVNLLGYILMLDIGVLVLAAYKRWSSLSFTAFILTFLLATATYYEISFAYGAFFLAAFFAVFLGFSVIRLFGQHKEFTKTSIAFAILTPLFYYGQMLGFLNLHDIGHYDGLFTLALATLYVILGSFGYKRQDDERILQTFYGAAITFITLAIFIEASGVWVTVLWALEGAVLFYIAQKNNYRVLEIISGIVLFFALIRFWGGEYWDSQVDVIANSRFVVGIMLTSILLFLRLQFPRHQMAHPALFVIFVGPLLLGFAEIETYFDWSCNVATDTCEYGVRRMQQGLSNSVFIIIYAIGIFYAGIWRKLAVLRKAALIMFLFAVSKVLLYDLWELGSGYRIASFIILGLVLLGVAFWYQKNQDTLFADKS
jgi:uncharacterized membrane protein